MDVIYDAVCVIVRCGNEPNYFNKVDQTCRRGSGDSMTCQGGHFRRHLGQCPQSRVDLESDSFVVLTAQKLTLDQHSCS